MKQKIVFFTLDISLKGGIERVVSNLSNRFSTEGYDVQVVSFFRQNEKLSYPFFNDVEISFINETPFFKENRISQFVNYLKLFNNIKNNLKNSDDIYISTFVNLSIFSGVVKFLKSKKYKIIAAEHSQFNAHNRFIKSLRAFSYKYLDGVVALTKQDYNKFNKLIDKNRLFVIPNSLTTDFSSKSKLENKIVITAGRLDPVKGFDDLITSFIEVVKKHRDWRLEIYGEGLEKQSLQELIENSQMTDFVSIKNYTTDIKSKFLASSIFVCSSKTEAFPMAMLEALSLGLPVVSFDCPVGPREIIIDGFNGYLVKNGDVEMLSKSLSKLINDKDKIIEFGNNAFEDSKKYSEDNIILKWKNMLKKISII